MIICNECSREAIFSTDVKIREILYARKHSFGDKPLETIRDERIFFCLECTKKNLLKYDFFSKVRS